MARKTAPKAKAKAKSRPESASSSQESSEDFFTAGPEQNMASVVTDAQRRVQEEHRRIANNTLVSVNKESESIISRYNQAINITHKAELNEIYTQLLEGFQTQDEILSTLLLELSQLDKEAQVATEKLATCVVDGNVQAAGLGKGCRASIAKAISDEKQGVEVVKIGFGGVPRKKRKTDDTLVASDVDGEEE